MLQLIKAQCFSGKSSRRQMVRSIVKFIFFFFSYLFILFILFQIFEKAYLSQIHRNRKTRANLLLLLPKSRWVVLERHASKTRVNDFFLFLQDGRSAVCVARKKRNWKSDNLSVRPIAAGTRNVEVVYVFVRSSTRERLTATSRERAGAWSSSSSSCCNRRNR